MGSSISGPPEVTGKGKRSACLVLGAALFVLPGCVSLAPEPPSMASVQPVPAQWVLAEPGATAVPLDRYWTMLGDPLVDEYVTRAKAENLDLAQAVARLRAARAGFRGR